MSRNHIGRILGLVLACALVIAGASISVQGAEDNYDGDIVIAGTVLWGDEPLDNATVDAMNESGDLVDSDMSNSDGEFWIETNRSLENSELQVSHDDLEDTHYFDINVSLPADSTNDTVIEQMTLNIDKDLTTEGKTFAEEHPIAVAGGGIFILIGIVATIFAVRDGKKPWE